MILNLDWRRETSALGNEVQYEIRPLRVWAFQELMAFWEGRQRESREGQAVAQVTPAESLKLMEVARRIFPDHVRQLAGVTLIREGGHHPATLEDLCDESPLIELAGEILGKLVAISELKPESEKN